MLITIGLGLILTDAFILGLLVHFGPSWPAYVIFPCLAMILILGIIGAICTIEGISKLS